MTINDDDITMSSGGRTPFKDRLQAEIMLRDVEVLANNSTKPIKIAVVGCSGKSSVLDVLNEIISKDNLPIIAEYVPISMGSDFSGCAFDTVSIDEISGIPNDIMGVLTIENKLEELNLDNELPNDAPINKKKKRMSRIEKQYRYGR